VDGVEMTETAQTFPVLGPGEHVCWLVRTADEFARGTGVFLDHGAALGDKTLIIGTRTKVARHHRSPAVTFIDPSAPRREARAAQGRGDATASEPHDPNGLQVLHAADSVTGPTGTIVPTSPISVNSVVLSMVRREVRLADLEGFRGLRVLAQMEAIAAPDCGLEELVEHELGLQEFAAGNAASVVCAYRQDFWKPSLLRDLTTVHLRHVGAGLHAAGFRVAYAGAGGWALDGVVDMDGARAFAALLRAVLTRGGQVRLCCAALELIDAAGLRVLREAVIAVPGASVRIEDANDTVRKAWMMSGYADAGLPVELVT
jgi:MEDS: MEthanogen/methylotroph, DcmR Sensory domain